VSYGSFLESEKVKRKTKNFHLVLLWLHINLSCAGLVSYNICVSNCAKKNLIFNMWEPFILLCIFCNCTVNRLYICRFWFEICYTFSCVIIIVNIALHLNLRKLIYISILHKLLWIVFILLYAHELQRLKRFWKVSGCIDMSMWAQWYLTVWYYGTPCNV